MTDDNTERDEEQGRPAHPPAWPKNDEVPEGGVPLPPDQWSPPMEDDDGTA